MRLDRAPMTALAVTIASAVLAGAPRFEARFILPPQEQHVHSSSIVELPSGDLFAVYYRGSGERRADDVRLEGARLAKGGNAWSAPFPVADTPGFPDCNPIAFVDTGGRLWVIWPAIVDNNWESAILRYRVAPTAGWTAGAPPWNDGGHRPAQAREAAAEARAGCEGRARERPAARRGPRRSRKVHGTAVGQALQPPRLDAAGARATAAIGPAPAPALQRHLQRGPGGDLGR